MDFGFFSRVRVSGSSFFEFRVQVFFGTLSRVDCIWRSGFRLIRYHAKDPLISLPSTQLRKPRRKKLDHTQQSLRGSIQ